MPVQTWLKEIKENVLMLYITEEMALNCAERKNMIHVDDPKIFE